MCGRKGGAREGTRHAVSVSSIGTLTHDTGGYVEAVSQINESVRVPNFSEYRLRGKPLPFPKQAPVSGDLVTFSVYARDVAGQNVNERVRATFWGAIGRLGTHQLKACVLLQLNVFYSCFQSSMSHRVCLCVACGMHMHE